MRERERERNEIQYIYTSLYFLSLGRISDPNARSKKETPHARTWWVVQLSWSRAWLVRFLLLPGSATEISLSVAASHVSLCLSSSLRGLGSVLSAAVSGREHVAGGGW